MPFTDLHSHPAVKTQLMDPATKLTPWEMIKAKLDILSIIKIGISKLFNEVLDSQSNLSQIIAADTRLIGLVLHAPERMICASLGERKIVDQGKVKLIDTAQVKYLATGKHYFELINTELKALINSKPPSALPGASFKIIRRFADFDETKKNTIFAVITIEGLHCFLSDPEAPDAKIRFDLNFDQFTAANTVLSIIVCHIEQNQFCNHAHGIQFFNAENFYPLQDGLTAWGREVIQKMIDRKILVDIKHMSLKSRWQLYSWFKNEEGETKFIQPLICTHAGTTGMSIRDRAKFLLRPPRDLGGAYEVSYLKPKSQHDPSTYHNCCSINLYDEDIENILLSGGIIGISFDQRILGFADENVFPNMTIPHDVEYISKQEANFFLGPNPTALPAWADDSAVWASEDFEELDPSLYAITHRKFLINNIIHILWVARNKTSIGLKKALKQICIATDFDGLINAIDCCKEVTGLQQLKDDITKELPGRLDKAGFGKEGINVKEFLDDLFYNNGKKFILERLRAME